MKKKKTIKNILAHTVLTLLAIVWVSPLVDNSYKLQGTEGSIYKLILP